MVVNGIFAIDDSQPSDITFVFCFVCVSVFSKAFHNVKEAERSKPQFRVLVRKGVGSNPTLDINSFPERLYSSISITLAIKLCDEGFKF